MRFGQRHVVKTERALFRPIIRRDRAGLGLTVHGIALSHTFRPTPTYLRYLIYYSLPSYPKSKASNSLLAFLEPDCTARSRQISQRVLLPSLWIGAIQRQNVLSTKPIPCKISPSMIRPALIVTLRTMNAPNGVAFPIYTYIRLG